MSEHDDRSDTVRPPTDTRLDELEARMGDLERVVRRQAREIRMQGLDRDLLMHSLRYLVQRHPADEEDTARAQLLTHFDRWEEQRARERELLEEEDDTRPSTRIRM